MNGDKTSQEANLLLGLFNPESLDVGGVIRRRWPVVTLGLLFGIGLAVAYFYVASVKYESTAQVLVMKKDNGLPARGVAERNEDSAPSVSEDLMATHMEIVQSPQIVRTALKKNNLEGLPSIQMRLRGEQTEVDYIINQLTVSRGGKGQARLANTLNVTFRHVSDVDCERILGALVQSYQDYLGERFQDVSKEAVRLIAQAKDELGKDLELAENEYQDFRRNAPLLWNGSESTNTHRLNFERLQTAISEARMLSATTKTRLEVVEQGMAARTGPADDLRLLALLDDTHINRLELLVSVKRGSSDTESFQSLVPQMTANSRLEYDGTLALALKKESLLTDFGPDHPSVKEVEHSLATTRDFIDAKTASLNPSDSRLKLDPAKLLSAYLVLLKSDIDALERREAELQSLSVREEEAAKKLVSYEFTNETLRKEVDRKQELYDAVIDRLREINLVKDYGGLVTDVIAPVKLGEKVWPKLHYVLLMGIAVGLVLGVGGAFCLENLDRTFRTPDEVRQVLDLPILTHMPKLQPVPPEVLAAKADALDPTLCTYYRPKSRESEAVRGLRTSLFFNCRGRKQQVVMVTSANPGDGKTLIAANLAVSIAQSGRKTLLIDADMRRPRVHQFFEGSMDVGLSGVIDGKVEPPDAVQSTKIPHLSIVACGPAPANPAELLSSPEFQQCLAFYRDCFEFVVIDCPPLLAVVDPCIVAPLTDGVILTLRIAKSTRSEVLRAKDLLESVDANVLGLVINGADQGDAMFSYGKYGYGGYGQYQAGAYFEEEDMANRVG